MKSETDAAQVGRMFVTSVKFQWKEKTRNYVSTEKGYVDVPGHWSIDATLNESACESYHGQQSMNIKVEHGIGQKLAEILIPVVIADASRKAQQLADESTAMLKALGERAVCCITDMAATEKATAEAKGNVTIVADDEAES